MKVYVGIAFLSAFVSAAMMADDEKCNLQEVDNYFESIRTIHLPKTVDEAKEFCSKTQSVIQDLMANHHLCRTNQKVTKGLNRTLKKVQKMQNRFCDSPKGTIELVELVKCFANIQFDEKLRLIHVQQVAAFEKAANFGNDKIRLGLCAATIKALEEKNKYLVQKCGEDNADHLRKVYLSLHNKRMCGTRNSKELLDRLGGDEQKELEAIYNSKTEPKPQFKTLAPILMQLLQKVKDEANEPEK